MLIDKPLPGLSRQGTARLVSFFSDITCGEGCWKAKEDICKCSCGGKNHGIHLRGENAIRTAKIDGYRYELVAVGKRNDLWDQAKAMITEHKISTGKVWMEGDQPMTIGPVSGKPFRYNASAERFTERGEFLRLKTASLPQCLKWPELEYFQIADDRDRYHADAAILWRRADLEKK